MTAASYRKLRVVVGALVLGFCTLAFVDISHWLTAPVARVGLWLQFTPSLLALAQGAGWIGAGVVVVVLLTLLVGRVYCAMLCPLGVLMDLSAWLTKRSGKSRKLPYRKGRTWLRTAVVLVCAGGLIAGTAMPVGWLDPYSLFGKITSSTLRPVIGWSNNLLSRTGMVGPVDVSPVSWVSIGVGLGLLAMIVITAIYRGRLWCNTACPVGAILGFFSKHSLFRLQIADAACIACSMCERTCPAQCIDFRNHSIDHSRCVMCLDCVTSCSRSGITLSRHPLRGRDDLSKPLPAKEQTQSHEVCSKANPLTEAPVSRRLFLTSAVAIPTVALASDRDSKNEPSHNNQRAVLPPGAISLDHFQSHCTACQLCVTHCPDQVLRPSITQHGLAGFLQPYQDFNVSFCSYNCSNCSEVCPTGAIQPLTIEERRAVRTGAVRFFEDLCVVKTDGTSCGACNEHCPTQAVHMVPWKNDLTIPEIDPDLCIGCGGCEFICPVRPHKAIIVDGLPVHERAKVVVLGQENTVREMEEEFPF